MANPFESINKSREKSEEPKTPEAQSFSPEIKYEIDAVKESLVQERAENFSSAKLEIINEMAKAGLVDQSVYEGTKKGVESSRKHGTKVNAGSDFNFHCEDQNVQRKFGEFIDLQSEIEDGYLTKEELSATISGESQLKQIETARAEMGSQSKEMPEHIMNLPKAYEILKKRKLESVNELHNLGIKENLTDPEWAKNNLGDNNLGELLRKHNLFKELANAGKAKAEDEKQYFSDQRDPNLDKKIDNLQPLRRALAIGKINRPAYERMVKSL